MTSLLILGGTSWLGGVLAAYAVQRGLDVTCLARGDSGDVPAGCSLVRTDRTSTQAYEGVTHRDWDLVVDVARQPGQVRRAVRALGDRAGHWTFVSTGSVYADQSGPLTEESPLLSAAIDDEVPSEQYGEGKVACEVAVKDLPGHLIVRAGLIGGPGDPSDRLGHYVARFALAGEGPVLVPDVADQPMQVIDVRDLAAWIVGAGQVGATGIANGAGKPITVGEIIDASATVVGSSNLVAADPDWLRVQGVGEWVGPRSLPLWLPTSHHGMGLMDDSRSIDLGLRRRSIAETLRDTLADERVRGLGRNRRAGLSRSDELELIERWRSGPAS